MRLAVASGKGGTGKTFIATNLAWHLAEAGHDVTYVDTDVEAPNGHLFLHPQGVAEERFSVRVPALSGERACTGCGACQEACAFNAIIALKDRVMVFPELCHACGACLLSCDENALLEQRREVGTLRAGSSGRISFRSAVLDIGEAKAPPLIQGLLDSAAVETRANNHLVILDSPPGTSCSAMCVVKSADLVLLVTEPTPFGLHDLKLATEMCRALGKPVVAIVNRADLGNGEVVAWLEQESVPLLAEIPFSQEVARAYADGALAARNLPALRQALDRVASAMIERVS